MPSSLLGEELNYLQKRTSLYNQDHRQQNLGYVDRWVQNATLYLAKSYFEVAHFHRYLKYVLCLGSFHSKNERVHLTWNWKHVSIVQKYNQMNILTSVSKISKHCCALNKSRKKKIWNERMKRTWKSSWRRQNYTTFNLRKVKYNGTPLQSFIIEKYEDTMQANYTA